MPYLFYLTWVDSYDAAADEMIASQVNEKKYELEQCVESFDRMFIDSLHMNGNNDLRRNEYKI